MEEAHIKGGNLESGEGDPRNVYQNANRPVMCVWTSSSSSSFVTPGQISFFLLSG